MELNQWGKGSNVTDRKEKYLQQQWFVNEGKPKKEIEKNNKGKSISKENQKKNHRLVKIIES